ncbi:MAG: tRNA (adenosine(37)-N6)-threonylcarbamoyltransferase complex ATPase subunit type 1 TsaE [Paludibacteraceae bacterium]|nr:tRNA (adenosine(37)-N6)-threonylcarbamoyltransferase complex ATPase subunit type 1 TsaE [Paludibacteraceae bacterium]
MQLTITSLSQIRAVAAQFLAAIGERRILAFYGPMGVGKTTFIKALCDEKGVTDTVNSPTFAIVNEYTDAEGEPIFHFDFYRIKQLAEVIDLGYENYIESGCLCLMEWPELIEPLLPDEVLKVYLSEDTDGHRLIDFEL